MFACDYLASVVTVAVPVGRAPQRRLLPPRPPDPQELGEEAQEPRQGGQVQEEQGGAAQPALPSLTARGRRAGGASFSLVDVILIYYPYYTSLLADATLILIG